ncbi:hypothetical protein [Paenibacillus agricola]|uniref:Lipoprotein n=1 Tax=Paenibacillus agricola TaxID=2716264 RepID=A0ABX0JDE9_9BACL|nr:hypothetical protein [Paenibacillus agricola]NHN33415.1 hypothetical protein [Paenibacillus agricola]
MENKKQSQSYKLVTLFVAAALVAAPGCTNRAANSNCVDANQDGYCDNGSGSRSSYFYGGGNSGVGTNNGSTNDSSPGISKGSTPHGGVGSSSGSSSS